MLSKSPTSSSISNVKYAKTLPRCASGRYLQNLLPYQKYPKFASYSRIPTKKGTAELTPIGYI